MKKAISLLLLVCLSMSLMGMAAAGMNDSVADVKARVLAYADEWFKEKFSEHYTITDLQSSLSNFKFDGSTVCADIAVGAITTLKYDSVETTPYMMGIKNSLQISSFAEIVPAAYATELSKAAAAELQRSVDIGILADTRRSVSRLSLDAETQQSTLTPAMAARNIMASVDTPVSEVQAMNLAMHISDKYVDVAECIGVGTVLTMDLIFEGTYNGGSFSDVALLESHDGEATANATALIPMSSAQMRTQAGMDITEYLSSEVSYAQTVGTRGLSTYDRVAARDYAWAHTYPGYGVNTYDKDKDGWTATEDCGHGISVDRSYWNDDVYPTQTCLDLGHCHDDCACFVSQCLVAGGIPTEEGAEYWDFPTDGTPTYAWHNTGGIKTYMTNNGYWEESTISECNAGNVMYTKSSHVTLCTLNDTVTTRYTAHTNDRNNKIYSSAYACYIINTD